jgi:hypothetical protein
MGGACSIQRRKPKKGPKIFVEKIKNEEICRWDDNIKMEFTETECACAGVDWRNVAQGRQMAAVVSRSTELLLSTECRLCCPHRTVPSLERSQVISVEWIERCSRQDSKVSVVNTALNRVRKYSPALGHNSCRR